MPENYSRIPSFRGCATFAGGSPEVQLLQPQERPVKRSVALAGATGLVGRSILEGLLADTSVQSVHVLARRKPRVVHARLTCHIVDFAALSPLPPVDEVYLALGTIIKVAGSQAAFGAVDFDANLAVGRAALAAGARRCGLVSAMGANAKSRVFYNRVKGELEEALAQLPFEGLVIAHDASHDTFTPRLPASTARIETILSTVAAPPLAQNPSLMARGFSTQYSR